MAFPTEWSLRQVCHLRQMKKQGRMDLRHLRPSPAQADLPSGGVKGTHAEAAAGQLCVSQQFFGRALVPGCQCFL